MEIEKAKSLALTYFHYEDLRTLIKDLKSEYSTKPVSGVVSIKVPVSWLPSVLKIAESELEVYEKRILDM